MRAVIALLVGIVAATPMIPASYDAYCDPCTVKARDAPTYTPTGNPPPSPEPQPPSLIPRQLPAFSIYVPGAEIGAWCGGYDDTGCWTQVSRSPSTERPQLTVQCNALGQTIYLSIDYGGTCMAG